MPKRPKFKLSRLREIAWTVWDPIGLREIVGGWEGSDAADEYDGYMLKVVGLLVNGGRHEEAVESLLRSEDDIMGMGVRPGMRERASKTVEAVSDYLKEFDQEC